MKIVDVIALVIGLEVAAAPALPAADRIVPPEVPTIIEAPAGYKPFLIARAVGTQNYICAPSPTGPKWLFTGPQATVFDADGEQKLTHFQSTNPLQGVEKSHLMRRDLRPHTRDALRCYKLQHASLLHRL